MRLDAQREPRVNSASDSALTQDISVAFPWSPVSIAVDWVGNKLYVCDALGQKIDLLELDGSRHAVLISRNLSSPSDIAIDPREG